MEYIKEIQTKTVIEELTIIHGKAERPRIERGAKQVARFWQKDDGSSEDYVQFCRNHYISNRELLNSTIDRYEKNLESVYGHLLEISRDLREPFDLNIGPMLPVDHLFAQYVPDAHTTEDLFKIKIAFVALLNFPLYTLRERLKLGSHWSRLQWAQVRLVQHFSARVPPEINQKRNQAYTNAEDYINNYNIYMHHILAEDGNRFFPPGLKLITHWNLRDEIKALYNHPEGLPRQKTIQQIMEKIILQEIPLVVINNPTIDWNPKTNELTISPVKDVKGAKPPESIDNRPEPNERYAHLLEIFHAERQADPYHPTTPSLIDRRFQQDREIPEDKAEQVFRSLLSSPLIVKTSKLIENRLGRPLHPFDIWYNGFKSRVVYPEPELDRIVSKKYPTPMAFQTDFPSILHKLGFSEETANFLASKVVVDPARGAGHAMGAQRREDNAHLRTRVPSGGMNYKGYNIALHEFGHNCEQVFSLNRVDRTLLSGVPNSAFTEAFAFLFQARDLELLGITEKDPDAEHLKALDDLWSTNEIAGVSLVDMAVWHWMYDHPKTTPVRLREAVLQIAREVWNTYYAPVFGETDAVLLAIYSHMICYGLYLPDYPLGHIIASQIEQYLKDKNLGKEMERMCRLGRLTPDAWMDAAVGQSISVEPMLKAAENALEVINNRRKAMGQRQ